MLLEYRVVSVQEFDVGVAPKEVVERLERFGDLTGLLGADGFLVRRRLIVQGADSYGTTLPAPLVGVGLRRISVTPIQGGRSHVQAKWGGTILLPCDKALWNELQRQMEAALDAGAFNVWAVDRATRRSRLVHVVGAFTVSLLCPLNCILPYPLILVSVTVLVVAIRALQLSLLRR